MTNAELDAAAQVAQQKDDEYSTALRQLRETIKAGNTPTQAQRDALQGKWEALVVAGDALS
jgi:hypothetical protein